MPKRRKDARAIAARTRRRRLLAEDYLALYLLHLIRFGGPLLVIGILGAILPTVIQEPLRKYPTIAGFWDIIEGLGAIILIAGFLLVCFYSGYITYKDSKDMGGEDD